MTLYTSVYWTKRVFVVLGLLLFLCSGLRIFQIASKSKLFSRTNTYLSEPKPELGFQAIDPVVLNPIQIPPDFSPKDWKNNTISGKLTPDELYPPETSVSPVANVYRISTRSIDIDTTNVPRKIAQNFGFTKEPTQPSPTVQNWKESNRELEIDGQYGLVKYKNSILKQFTPTTTITIKDESEIKNVFDSLNLSFGITTDFKGYTFRSDYVNWDKNRNSFVPSGSKVTGQYIRLNAIRIFPNLTKVNATAKTAAVYPEYTHSNNYVIISGDALAKAKENLVEMGIYNWPLNQTISPENPDVQTYPIKTPKAAFEELKKSNKYLITVTEVDKSNNRLPISTDELSGITSVQLFDVSLKMYEDIVNTTYIQPVYVLTCLAVKNNKQIELIYYVPAINYSNQVQPTGK